MTTPEFRREPEVTQTGFPPPPHGHSGYSGPPDFVPPSSFGPPPSEWGPPPGLGAQPAGYGYPPGYGVAPAPRVSAPPVGWVLVLLGVLGIVGSVGTWITLSFDGVTQSYSGGSRDGRITVVLAAGVAVLGLLIGLRKGRTWTSIVGIVLSAICVLTALADIGDVAKTAQNLTSLSDLPSDAVKVGWGLWLVLAAAVGMLAASIVALARRR